MMVTEARYDRGSIVGVEVGNEDGMAEGMKHGA
jgi:hypothetical protein